MLPWFAIRQKELTNRPLIREQAFAEALDPDKLEGLAATRFISPQARTNANHAGAAAGPATVCGPFFVSHVLGVADAEGTQRISLKDFVGEGVRSFQRERCNLIAI